MIFVLLKPEPPVLPKGDLLIEPFVDGTESPLHMGNAAVRFTIRTRHVPGAKNEGVTVFRNPLNFLERETGFEAEAATLSIVSKF